MTVTSIIPKPARITKPATRMWWDEQPAPVRAVLDLAYLRPDASPDVHDRIVALLAPTHADAIADIASKLSWLERFDYEPSREVLSDYYGERSTGDDRDVDRLADELRGDALTMAQLVASLLTVGRAA